MEKQKPILLIKRSTGSYLYPEEPVLIHPNGDITCGDKVAKDNTRQPYLKEQYDFMADYLKRKRLPFDVSNFHKMDLGDIVESMQSRGAKSISLADLLDIYSYRNQIFGIRDHMIRRLSDLERKRWWKRYREADVREAARVRSTLEKNRKVVNEIINFRR